MEEETGEINKMWGFVNVGNAEKDELEVTPNIQAWRPDRNDSAAVRPR